MKEKIIVLLGVVGVSFSSILVKYSSAPSTVMALYRMFFSAAVLLPMVLYKNRSEIKSLDMKTLLLCISSGIALAFHFSFYFESVKQTTVASSTVLVDTEIFFVAFISVLMFKEKLTKFTVIGIIITFCGSTILALVDSSSASGGSLRGDLFALTGALFVSIYTIIGSRVRDKVTTNVYTFIVYSSASVTLLIVNLILRTPVTGYAPVNYLLGLGLCILCTLLGHNIFSWGLKYLPAAFISNSKLGEPVFASILALILFSQKPGVTQIAGCIIVLIGTYIVTISTGKKESTQSEQE